MQIGVVYFLLFASSFKKRHFADCTLISLPAWCACLINKSHIWRHSMFLKPSEHVQINVRFYSQTQIKTQYVC